MDQTRERRALNLLWCQAAHSQGTKRRCTDLRAIQLPYNASHEPARASFCSIPWFLSVTKRRSRRELSLRGTPPASKSLNSFQRRVRCLLNSSQSIWIRTCAVLSTVTSRSHPRFVGWSSLPDHALTSGLVVAVGVTLGSQ